MKKQRLVILSDENILDDQKTSSVAIRQLFLAQKLAQKHRLTIATSWGKPSQRRRSGFTVINGVKDLNFIAHQFDVVILPLSSSFNSIAHRYLKSSINLPTIVDSYFAILFEKLVSIGEAQSGRGVLLEKLAITSSILKRGDHFIVAAPRQRHYLLGRLTSLGKINPSSFSRQLVSIVPHLFDVRPSQGKTIPLRGQVVGQKDKVILWLGGIYPWFNPLPLVKAMPAISRQLKTAKLVIVGGRHPLASFDDQYQKTVTAAQKTGLSSKQIVFIDWVEKQQSLAYCAEADVCVVLSRPTLEDEFAYRTRTLTPLLLGVPTITNGRDYLSRLITLHSAGVVCQTDRPSDLTRAIITVIGRRSQQAQMSQHTRSLISQIRQDTHDQPLLQFLKNPSRVKPVSAKPADLLKLQIKNWLR